MDHYKPEKSTPEMPLSDLAIWQQLTWQSELGFDLQVRALSA
jgi:hypothetical protein